LTPLSDIRITQYRMARTTTDPKPYNVVVRLNKDDERALNRLAKTWKCSRSDVLRKLVRGEKPPKR